MSYLTSIQLKGVRFNEVLLHCEGIKTNKHYSHNLCFQYTYFNLWSFAIYLAPLSLTFSWLSVDQLILKDVFVRNSSHQHRGPLIIHSFRPHLPTTLCLVLTLPNIFFLNFLDTPKFSSNLAIFSSCLQCTHPCLL